eukprot:CAMPEP_0204073234 /NCGR_PEP_ID=MMETSP0360-20130528/162942_1 /ASSEMBLY_ACC=CAM_ASM_000342 /TAXON_ID=268821 /ORGANISM="Scrippsiella Hangoei, Strain SHTV-5" /LENGTH=67 /DNA_ID=CAMNT_0051021613 /DNA_START=202 /DNA_END=405 /DNA_ORIENTATION=+
MPPGWGYDVLPAAHDLQLVELPVEYLPMSHSSHPSDPALEEKVPEGHAVQLAASVESENLPAAHSRQ